MKSLLIDTTTLLKFVSYGIRSQLIPNVAGLLTFIFNFDTNELSCSSLLLLSSFDDFPAPLTNSLTT